MEKWLCYQKINELLGDLDSLFFPQVYHQLFLLPVLMTISHSYQTICEMKMPPRSLKLIIFTWASSEAKI